MAYTLFGLLYVLWLFNFITKIVYLTPRSSTGQLTGQFYVLYLIAVTKFADMALDEKVNALDKKVKALFEKEQATLSAGTTATGVQGQTPDPAQVTAERDRTIQQFRAMIPNPSQVTAGEVTRLAKTGWEFARAPARSRVLERAQGIDVRCGDTTRAEGNAFHRSRLSRIALIRGTSALAPDSFLRDDASACLQRWSKPGRT
jgi:hypothetical protein